MIIINYNRYHGILSPVSHVDIRINEEKCIVKFFVLCGSEVDRLYIVHEDLGAHPNCGVCNPSV